MTWLTIFDLAAKITLDSAEYESGIQSIKNSVDGFAKKAKIAFAAASAAFVAFTKSSLSDGAKFDAAMSQVAATMGKTTDEISELREFAKKMGATTAFSATQSAEALNYMALAGYSAEKAMATLPSVLDLAAAGGMDLARASDMVTDAESALGLTAEQSAAMVDQMAKTASKSNTSVSQLGDAMLTIGGTAKLMAGGTDRLQTVLGLLADNGIKGSEAGTNLRNMLLKLASPTKEGAAILERFNVKIFDSSGNMRDMQDIMLELNDALATITDEEKTQALADLFNARDIAAANALLGTSKKRWKELGTEIKSAQGSAEKMAGTQLDNLTGDITIMKSALEGAKIQLSDGITPAIRGIVQQITRALSQPKTKKFLNEVGEKLGELVTFISEKATNAFERLAGFFSDGGKRAKELALVIAGVATALKISIDPVGGLVSALGLLVGVLGVSALTADTAREKFGGLTDAERDLTDAADNSLESYKELGLARAKSFFSIDQETEKTKSLWSELKTLVDENGNVKKGYEDRVLYISTELKNALGTEMELNDGVLTGYKDQAAAIDELIEKRRAERKLAESEEQYETATKGVKEYADAIEATKREINELEKALKEVASEQIVEGSLEYFIPVYGKIKYEKIETELNNIRDALAGAKQRLEEYTNAESEALDDISDYESAFVALESGKYSEVSSILDGAVKDRWAYKAETGRITEEELAELKRQADSALQAVERYGAELDAGNKKRSAETYNDMRKNAEELLQIWKDAKEKAHEAGSSVSDGLSSGIWSKIGNIRSTAVQVATSIIDTMRDTLDIHSPSKAGRAIGLNVGNSVGLGLEDSYKKVVADADKLSNGILEGLSDDFSKTVEFGSLRISSQGVANDSRIVEVLSDIRNNMDFNVVLDDGTLVGRIDKALGKTALRKARGNA